MQWNWAKKSIEELKLDEARELSENLLLKVEEALTKTTIGEWTYEYDEK